MKELLTRLIGHRIDVLCSGSSGVRGEVVKVEGGLLHLREDEQVCYIAIDRISVVWEVRDGEHRAGFVSPPRH